MKPAQLTEESIELLNRLSARLAPDDPAQALQFAETAFNEAKRINQQAGIAEGLKNISYCNYLLSNYNVAAEKATEAINHYKRLVEDYKALIMEKDKEIERLKSGSGPK